MRGGEEIGCMVVRMRVKGEEGETGERGERRRMLDAW